MTRTSTNIVTCLLLALCAASLSLTSAVTALAA